ncbi:hypothetical protein D9C01_12515, partial [Corynebacterium diphtheriae]
SQLLEYLVHTARNRPTRLDLGRPTVLRSHAHYKREEILSALDIATWEKKQDSHREGVMYSPAYDADALLVTLNKDSGTFSPSTMYKDYAFESIGLPLGEPKRDFGRFQGGAPLPGEGGRSSWSISFTPLVTAPRGSISVAPPCCGATRIT